MDFLTMSIIGLVVGTVAYISGAMVTSYAGWKVWKTTKREEAIIKPVETILEHREDTPFVNMLIIEYRYLEPIEPEHDVWSVVEKDDSLWTDEIFSDDDNWTVGFTSTLPEYTLVEGCDVKNFFDFWNGLTAQYDESLMEGYDMTNFLGFGQTEVSENLVDELGDVLEPLDLKRFDDMTVAELREQCNIEGIVWKNAHGKNKHLKKAEMLDALKNKFLVEV